MIKLTKKDALLLSAPLLIIFAVIYFLRGEMFTEWDGTIYFFPSFVYFKNAMLGLHSLAFAEQWFSGAPFFTDYQTGSMNVYYWIGFLLSNLFSDGLSFSLITLIIYAVFLLGQFKFLSIFTQDKRLLYYLAWASTLLSHSYFKGTHIPTMTALSFLPWMAYFAFNILGDKITTKAIIGLTLCFYAQIQAGAPYLWFAPGFIIFVFSFILKKNWNVFFIVNLSLLSGLLMSCIMLVPFFEFSKLSERASITFEQFVHGSLHPFYLITLLVPYIFGGRGNIIYDNPYFGAMDAEIIGMFFGYLPLIACALMVIFSIRHWNACTNLIRTMIVFLFFFLALSLGRHLPLAHLTYLVPGFGSLRMPARNIPLFLFFIFPLAALFLDGLTPGKLKKIIIGLVVCLVVVILTAIFSHLPMYPQTTPKPMAFIIPGVVLLIETLLVKKFGLKYLFLFLLADIFVMNTFDYRGLNVEVNYKSESNFRTTNNRVLYSKQLFKAKPLLVNNPSILGYTSLSQPRYFEYFGVKRMDMFSEDLCNKLTLKAINEVAIKYVINLNSNLPCPEMPLNKIGENVFEIIGANSHIFEAKNSNLTVKNDPEIFTYKKIIKTEKPTDEISARYFDYPGFSMWAKVGGTYIEMKQQTKKPYRLSYISEVPSNEFIFKYEIPGLLKGFMLTMIGIMLLLGMVFMRFFVKL